MNVVVLVDITPKRNVLRLVESKVAANQCLLCGQEASKRGLCDACYARYRTQLHRVPRSKRTEFQAHLIRDGHLLPSRQGQRLVNKTPFFELAQEYQDG